MQGFYFVFKFKFDSYLYKKGLSSILLKNLFNSLLAFFFWKACTFSSFEIFPCWKSRNYSQHFTLIIYFEIYLSRIVNYWGSIFTLYLTQGAFGCICVLSVFLFFLFLLFFSLSSIFLSVFSVTDTNDSQHSREGRRNDYFCFSLPPGHEHSFSSSRFLPLLSNWSLTYQTNIWWDLFFLRDWGFTYIFIDAIQSEFLALIFQSDIVRIWAHIKLASLLFQSERLKLPKVTPIATTVYLSHLPNPTSSHHLCSLRLPKCIRNEGCFFKERLGKE